MQTKAFSLGLGVSFLTSFFGLKDGFGLDGWWVLVGLSDSSSLW
jgi:hypothetical protein